MIDYEKLSEQYREQLDVALNQLDQLGIALGENPKDKAIRLDWLHKELVEQMYNRNLSEETMKVFHDIIGSGISLNEYCNENQT